MKPCYDAMLVAQWVHDVQNEMMAGRQDRCTLKDACLVVVAETIEGCAQAFKNA